MSSTIDNNFISCIFFKSIIYFSKNSIYFLIYLSSHISISYIWFLYDSPF